MDMDKITDGDLTLIANNQAISGWETIRATRGIERCPNDFDISLSEPFSKNDTATIIVKRGDSFKLQIGDDTVITGYIDKYIPFIAPTTHGIRITGRGKCQDLVDCAAEWPSGQISKSSVLTIAKKLASVYPGLNVSASDDVQSTEANQTALIPKQNIIIGETAYELIERVCRFRGYLAYELPDGSLYLSQVGTTAAASGFEQGQNVQQASFEMSIDRRYSSYECYYNSIQILNDIGFNVFPYYSSTDTGAQSKNENSYGGRSSRTTDLHAAGKLGKCPACRTL
ncbi:MAG: phage baseplate assembly protein [Smithella sp.]|jgi:prophage tail gpP-like protein